MGPERTWQRPRAPIAASRDPAIPFPSLPHTTPSRWCLPIGQMKDPTRPALAVQCRPFNASLVHRDGPYRPALLSATHTPKRERGGRARSRRSWADLRSVSDVVEMQGFAVATYRPSYRHPAVTTCRLGKPGHILGSAATGTARSAVGGPFQTFLAEHRARATGVSL